MDTITIREFYRRAQAGKLQAGEYRLEKYGRAAYVVTVAGSTAKPECGTAVDPVPVPVELAPVVQDDPALVVPVRPHDWVADLPVTPRANLLTEPAEPVPVPVAIPYPINGHVIVALVPAEPGTVILGGQSLKVNPAMERFLAKSKPRVAEAEPVPEFESEPGAPYYGMTRREWKLLEHERRLSWLKRHGLAFAEESEFMEWLEEMLS